MNIIPHNAGFVQVGIIKNTDQSQTCNKTNTYSQDKSVAIGETASRLHSIGLNVLPQPLGQKGGYPWRRLQYCRLSLNHKSYGLSNLFAGACNLAIMCGRTSGNLFVIDCETLWSFQYHTEQVRKRGIALWAVKTSRGGHIYLRALDGEVHNIELGTLWGAEIKGQRGYVLAPPSVHPSGAIYQWYAQEGEAPPSVYISQIDWLTDSHNNRVSLSVDRTSQSNEHNFPTDIRTRNNLSRKTREYIKSGHTVAEGSRNNRLFSAACDLNGNHYTFSQAISLLEPVATASGLDAVEVRKTIRSAYSKSREPARPIFKYKEKKNNQIWYHAFLFATKHKWTGRTKTTDQVIFLALCERARLSSKAASDTSDGNKQLFRASIRELAALARMGTNTVQKALKRLIEQKLIKKSGYDKTSQATLWQFEVDVISIGKEIELNLDTVGIAPHWLRFSVSIFNLDASERGALGHSVMFVYQAMLELEEKLMPSKIAELLGISINRVNYALRKLRRFALVRRLRGGWRVVRKQITALDEYVAQFADMLGKGQARRARFQREREVYAGYTVFQARMRSEGKVYRQAISRSQAQRRYARRVEALLADPLVLLGLELGGVVCLDEYCTLQLK